MLQSLIEIQQQLLTGIVTLNLPERKTGVLTNQAESVLAGLKALQAVEAEVKSEKVKAKSNAPAPVNKKPATTNKKPNKK